MTSGRHDTGNPITFARADDDHGIVVTDEIEDHSLAIHTDEPPAIAPSDPDSFIAPLDDAVTFYASELEIDEVSSVSVFDEYGNHLRGIGAETVEFERGTYYLNILSPFVGYIRLFETEFEVRASSGPGGGLEVTVACRGSTRIEVGARSEHSQPAATITVSDDLQDVAEAISHLGSGIKEWSCERSWPTLRGHSPAVERGAELHIPGEVTKPDTGITIEVPNSRLAMYRVATLATYVGAEVTIGDRDETTLRLENGYSESLGAGVGAESKIDALLGKTFFLDSLVRIGGYYNFDRYEYEKVGSHLPFSPPELYDATISEQLMEYLEVSLSDVERYLPEWPLTAVVRDTPEDVGVLPYLANDLARIHTVRGEDTTTKVSPSMSVGYTGADAPAGIAQIRSDSYERGIDVPMSTQEEARCIVIGAPEALASSTAVAASQTPNDVEISITSVPPSREEVRSALESVADCAVVGVPANEGILTCSNGSLSLSEVAIEVSTVLLTNSGRETASRAVDAGALNAVAVGGDDAGTGRIAGYLLGGCTLADSTKQAAIEPQWWLVGNPTRATIVGPAGPPGRIEVESVTPDSHRVAENFRYEGAHRFGGAVLDRNKSLPDKHFLIGTTIDLDIPVETEVITKMAEKPGTLLTLNGERIHDLSRVTEEFVRASAREAVAERTEAERESR
ncbi:hypothetical protein [Halocalculus aciditolerans]|uniref:Uncharacterized protein n=1 Tax=Halocalculus aciditolerans TaxID=1383812 RepID=A0A830F538_9EURY|nr:hypothetical protein [Halocalculus aciditolerans]GGL63899.1 hypothetical protein GCM10009039_22190 [Halocalculus aciditolerans]